MILDDAICPKLSLVEFKFNHIISIQRCMNIKKKSFEF